MKRLRISRRHMLTAIAGGALLAAPLVRRTSAGTLDKLVYQTGWLPQAEHGGLYQAVGAGIYKEYGLDVEVRKGGPQLDINTIFLAGRVDFIESNSFAVFNYVRQSLPGIAVAAYAQKDPRVLLSHPGVGNDTLESLKGKTILVATSGRQTFWQWLKAKYGFVDEQARPYTFNMAPFLANKTWTQQGFITSEPFDMRRAGVDPVIHFLADEGWGNYLNITLASPKMVAEKPDLIQRFVEASMKGWQSYLEGDPSPGNALIRSANPDMTQEKIDYAIATMNKWGIFKSGDALELGLGAMTDERWKRFYEEMVAAGAQPPGLDVSKGYTLQFVNKRVAT
jgi:NitT/TauT family transport system substrate-binding protein